MSKNSNGFNVGDTNSNYQSSSQAAYQKPIHLREQKVEKKEFHGSNISLGEDDGYYESEAKYQQVHGLGKNQSFYKTPVQRNNLNPNFVSSTAASYTDPSTQHSYNSIKAQRYGAAGESSAFTSYAVTNGDVNMNTGESPRQVLPSVPGNTNSCGNPDNLLSSRLPPKTTIRLGAPSSFVIPHANAYPRKSFSSTNNNNGSSENCDPSLASSFRSSNSAYGSGGSVINRSRALKIAAAGTKNAVAGRRESRDFQIGSLALGDSTYMTSTASAYGNKTATNTAAGRQGTGGRFSSTSSSSYLSSFDSVTGESQ